MPYSTKSLNVDSMIQNSSSFSNVVLLSDRNNRTSIVNVTGGN
ncbi:11482_t:CDS:2 [Funneliformis geosporum]|uniref:11482_t:CDS:1 n=1 Tax=Funneliformis geosporum TaxID=1117311 RepID=A0A9W4SS90_9GLOM|nr:11482_t:CDS:2 [Funneliformis geosporum]